MFGEIPKKSRFGHAMGAYKKMLIIFGGTLEIDITHIDKDTRECTNDTRIFNLETHEWKTIKSMNSGDYISPRRNMAYTFYGKHLMIHGGIDLRNKYLNELCHFEFSN